MRVIREKSILDKIDAEIDDMKKPPIVRIDLDEKEFGVFLADISKGIISISLQRELVGIKPNLINKVRRSNVGKRRGNWRGSYVVYRDVCVQCYYDEE